ncbi:hypothetical protein BHE74_00013785 [Ensete ventricosum]|nr:hypothetical protein BHE74_00013785 [Ensete ventricosum]
MSKIGREEKKSLSPPPRQTHSHRLLPTLGSNIDTLFHSSHCPLFSIDLSFPLTQPFLSLLPHRHTVASPLLPLPQPTYTKPRRFVATAFATVGVDFCTLSSDRIH